MSIRNEVLRYLLDSDQQFRDASRGEQATKIMDYLDASPKTLLTISRALTFWQTSVKIAIASPRVHKERKKRQLDHGGATDMFKKREDESLYSYQDRILATLPEDLRISAKNWRSDHQSEVNNLVKAEDAAVDDFFGSDVW